MFRRLSREYFSLTRGERHGIQVLGLLVILLILFRAMLPRMLPSDEPDFSKAGEEFLAFLDSLQELEIQAAAGYEAGPTSSGRRTGHMPGKQLAYNGSRAASANESRQASVHQSSVKTRTFELNRADSIQLISVYGIGPVFARRIIRYRELLGGFYSHSQLMEVYGFCPTQLGELVKNSYIDTTLLRKLDLNRTDAAGFAGHPYLDRYQAGALVAYREQMGSFSCPVQVKENHLLPDTVFIRIQPYLQAGR